MMYYDVLLTPDTPDVAIDSRLHKRALPYVLPFVAFIALMATERLVRLPPGILFPLRLCISIALILGVSRKVLSVRLVSPVGSIIVGIAVFAIWIGPDIVFGPAYRSHWLFANPITGQAASSVPQRLRDNALFVLARAISCTVAVPILEELFWRGWLMRWLIRHDFETVKIGQYLPSAFWIVALLFASEHGSYWDVGLAAGIAYNWWCVRSGNLMDCIVAHSVTNCLLSVYVLQTGHWRYWL